MHEKLELLHTSTIFTALTRPPMIMGITLDYLVIIFFIAISAFIATASLKYLIIYVPLHILGFIACKVDHNIFTLLYKNIVDCQITPNKKIYGCQSYEPF